MAQRKGHVRTQKEAANHLSQGERSQEKPTLSASDLGIPASKTMRTLFFVVYTIQSVVFCYGSPDKSIHKAMKKTY